MAKNTVHVVASSAGGWSVRMAGADRASRNFDTRDEAIDYGRDRARKDASDMFIHERNGQVSDHVTYGK